MQNHSAQVPVLGELDQVEGEILEAMAVEIRAAEERGQARGFQRGLVVAGEPWVALFAGLAGGLLGWVAHAAWLAQRVH